MARGGPSRKARLWFPFQRARRALADAAGAANPLGGRRATAGSRLSLLPPPAAAPKRTKISAMVQVCAAGIAAQSTLPGALQHAEEWRVGGCGRAQGQGLGRRHGAMQGRPLRCQHGRRWSQSARARWCCISWRSGGRLAVPGPKSDRAAPSWRGWVAQKSAAHHAMVPMQLHKHCHSRDLAERWRLAYCIILWPLFAAQRQKAQNLSNKLGTTQREMTKFHSNSKLW